MCSIATLNHQKRDYVFITLRWSALTLRVRLETWSMLGGEGLRRLGDWSRARAHTHTQAKKGFGKDVTRRRPRQRRMRRKREEEVRACPCEGEVGDCPSLSGGAGWFVVRRGT